MRRTIIGVAAPLVGAVALAGCGGGGSAGGTASVTTGGVAGAHHAKAQGNFRAGVHGFEARIQASVQKFEKGDISGAATSGGSLLGNCTNVVNGKLAPRASTHAQHRAVVHLRIACSDMSKAANAGMSGNMAKAKAFARATLEQAQTAAKLAG